MHFHFLIHPDSLLTKKGNVHFTFMSVYSKRMQLFYSISLFQQRWSFSSVMHQTKINSMVISANNNAASTSTQISKVTQSISRVSSISLTVVLNGHTAELLWVPGVFLAVITAGINLSRKSDVTKRRSRPCLVTRRRYLAGRSVWKPAALNILQRCRIVWDEFFFFSTVRRPTACQNHVNVIFADVLTWFSGKLTREIRSVWCFFTSLRHCQMNEMKIKCQVSLSASHQTHVQF